MLDQVFKNMNDIKDKMTEKCKSCKDIVVNEKFDMATSIHRKNQEANPMFAMSAKGDMSCAAMKILIAAAVILLILSINAAMTKAAVYRKLRRKIRKK